MVALCTRRAVLPCCIILESSRTEPTPPLGLICNAAGNLFGTTDGGGTGGAGTVYETDSAGHQESAVEFRRTPMGPIRWLLSRPTRRAISITTIAGGSTESGVPFKIDNTGNESVLYSFTGGTDGFWLVSGVVFDSADNLYGAAEYGGSQPGFAHGTIYKLDTEGSFTVLYTFTGGAD